MTKNWTYENTELLKTLYGKVSNKKLASLMDRSKQAIQHKAHRLNITTLKVAAHKWCVDCGKELSRTAWYIEKVKRCRECADEWHSTENHWNWKGGVSPLRSLVHLVLKPVWIDPIMQRDLYTCQECGKRGGDLEVHHVRPYHQIRDAVIKRFPELDLDVFENKKRMALLIVEEHDLEDGITFCIRCHSLIHNMQRGELTGKPKRKDVGNQQPSLSNVVNFVDRKVHRLTLEDNTTNKSDTSAPADKNPIIGKI